MAAEGADEGRSGIGTRLRVARERKGLTVLQAAEKIHTDPKILELLEAEDFAGLGAPVYVRGHLRHYAELVGESARELQELYVGSARAAPLPDLTQIAKAPPRGDPGALIIPALFFLVACAVAGTVWWLMRQPPTQPALLTHLRPPGQSAAQNAPNSPGSPNGPDAANGAGGSAAPPNSASAQEAQPNAGASTSEAAPAGVRPVTGDKSAAAGASASAKSGERQKRASTASEASPASKHQAELTLKFSSDSWAEVYDAAGQRLFFAVGPAESVRTLKGSAPLRVVLGNAPGVAVEVNGHPTVIAKLMQPDGSARFLINTAGRAVSAKPAANGE